MQEPAIPITEAERLSVLHASQLLHSPAEESFDRLTRLAARLLKVPTILVSLIDKDKQWFKSRVGMAVQETPRNVSFCGHAILAEDMLIIPDTTLDSRFSDNPLVTGAPHIRFYAGAPLYSINRMKIGTLCALDSVPRTFSEEDMHNLHDLARMVEEVIQKRQLALVSSRLLPRLHATTSFHAADMPAAPLLEPLLCRDNLTGLPNRLGFQQMLASGLHADADTGACSFIACLDIDQFSALNQTLGHRMGDSILISVAKRLSVSLRGQGQLARIGGNEFAIVLHRMSGADEARDRLTGLMEELAQPMSLDKQQVSLSCRIGYAGYPLDGGDEESLLNAASVAMHHAKSLGYGQMQHYHTNLRKPAKGRLLLEGQLRHALQRGELELHYQPQVSLKTGSVTGVEALLRWRHPTLGLIAPGEFIPMAEESGLIVPIGEWVLQTACRQAQAWTALGLPSLSVAVNVSGRQFLQDGFVSTVAAALQDTGLPASQLELEITESLPLDNPARSTPLMREIKKLGVAVSIDDFGTGYSSLIHLKRLPIDKIKIDRSFICDMTENEDALTIVQALIAMAHRLNLQVIAEGVETEAQLAVLAANRCDEIQGYFFSKPLPVTDCTALLASRCRLAVQRRVPQACASR